MRAVLARVERGETTGDALAREGGHSRKSFENFLNRHPDLKAIAYEALRTNGVSGKPIDDATWERVIAAADVHKSPRAIAALPGMPACPSIYLKLKQDTVFAARFRAKCRPRKLYSNAEIEAAVAALERGIPLTKLPAMGLPCKSTLQPKRKADPALDARISAAIAAQKLSDQERKLLVIQALDIVKARGISIRELSRVAPTLPNRGTLLIWRRREAGLDSAFSAARRAVPRYSDADYSRVVGLLGEGRPLSSLYRDGLPEKAAIYARRRRDAAFDQRVRTAQAQGRWAALGHEFAFRRALSQNEIYAAVDNVLGRSMDPTVREEVRSEMILAVLDGDIGEGEITRETAREFVSAYHRAAGTYGAQSFDAPVGRNASHSLLDVFAR